MSAYPELDWIATARSFLGTREIKGAKHNPLILSWLDKLNAWWSDDETAWCGTFTAICLKSNGIKIPKFWMRALDYSNYGTKLPKPCYGCIAVKKRKGGGHVTFVVGKTDSGKLVCLGGNQSDMVCYALYDVSDFEDFMWYGHTATPANHRYELPILKNVKAVSVTES